MDEGGGGGEGGSWPLAMRKGGMQDSHWCLMTSMFPLASL